MSSRSRVTTLVIGAVVFLALVFGARGIARDLAAPFDGLEKFAKARGAATPEPENEFQETLRNIDWDAPAYASPAPRAKSKAAANPRLALARALRLEAGEALVVSSLRQLAEVEVQPIRVAFVLNGGEPDLESLSAQLNLSESQKAAVSSLLEWRKWSLDALAEFDGDEESKERINSSFRDAVESILDPDQSLKFQGPQSRTRIGSILLQSGTRNESNAMKEYLRRVVAERK